MSINPGVLIIMYSDDLLVNLHLHAEEIFNIEALSYSLEELFALLYSLDYRQAKI